MTRVRIGEDAERDLERIADYIAESSPKTAVAFTQRLLRHGQSLVAYPLKYPLLPGHETSGIRRSSFGNYLVFYRIHENEMEIVHCIHAAMDYTKVLFPED